MRRTIPPPFDEPARAMRVACVMLSHRRGGLEQSLLDYCEALRLEGAQPIAIVDPRWPDRPTLAGLAIDQATCRSWSEWDPWSVHCLRRLLQRLDPAVILTIGRRASTQVRRARRSLPAPHVARTPNYRLAPLVGLDHVLTTTEDLRRALLTAGHPAAQITVVPNMVRVPGRVRPRRRAAGELPVIGALGRFVAKKGFDRLIEALALLQARGYRFKARLGGSGPEAAELSALVARRGLNERVEFPGWVSDKSGFFSGIDVFCLPSVEEPFGIVVLESLAHATATIVTDTEGPSTIIRDQVDGLVVRRGDPGSLAVAIAVLLDDDDLRLRLAYAGLETARRRYDLPVVARQIRSVLEQVVSDGARR